MIITVTQLFKHEFVPLIELSESYATLFIIILSIIIIILGIRQHKSAQHVGCTLQVFIFNHKCLF